MFRKNAGESTAACSSQGLHQNSLCLVVQGMRGSNAIGFVLLQDLRKKSLAQLASCSLQTDVALSRAHASFAAIEMKLQIVSAGKTSNESFIGVGIGSANSMVKMRN